MFSAPFPDLFLAPFSCTFFYHPFLQFFCHLFLTPFPYTFSFLILCIPSISPTTLYIFIISNDCLNLPGISYNNLKYPMKSYKIL